MNKTLRALILLTGILALVIMLLLALGLRQDQRLFLEKQSELEVSRAAWESIAAEKEALQEDLKELSNALKEANLTLEESLARAETLRTEIEDLELEIQALKSRTETAAD